MRAPTPRRSRWRVYVILYTLALIDFAVALDSTSISVALPTITHALTGTSIQAFWVGTSFLLASTLIQPIICLISDIFGRKFAILISLITLTTGSIVAALSHNFTVLILARPIQGAGAGGFSVMSEVLLTDLIPLRERGKWFGILGVVYMIGYVCGPLIGAAFAQFVSWRWIFWVNLPFAGVGMLVIPAFLTLRSETTPLRERLAQVDYVGIAVFTTSLCAFLVALSWGGVVYAWSAWRTLVPLVLGVMGLLAFAAYEVRVGGVGGGKTPFIPPHIWANGSSTANYVGICILGVVTWTLLYYLPMYYEGVKGYSMIIAGVAIFPETLTVGPVGIAVSFAISMTGRYRWALWAGWMFATFGMGILYLMSVDSTVLQWIFLNVPIGIGMGFLMPSTSLGIQASAPADVLPMSVTMLSTFRSLGRSVGVAIGGVIFQNRMKLHLSRVSSLADKAAEYSRDAAGLISVIGDMPDSTNKHSLRRAYAQSLADVWVVMCAASGVGLFLSFFIKGFSMNRGLSTKQPLKGSEGDQEDGESATVEGVVIGVDGKELKG